MIARPDPNHSLIKDCFWEYNFTAADVKKIIKSGNMREKQFLFEKILANSTHLFRDLKIFTRDNLEILIGSYTVPAFNREYLSRRKNMVEYHFFNQELTIEELKWTV